MTTIDRKVTTRPSGNPSRARAASLGLLRAHVVGAVFGRNFLGYFSNPAGYVFITLFVFVCSWAEFWQPGFFADNLANLDPLNDWMPFILLVFVPAITMNIWAEERKQGTDELLLTLPARDVEVVLGKYGAAVGIYSIALAFLGVGHVALLESLGQPDLGVLAATFLGYWLMGGLLIAIGMVASILSTNVTVAFILGVLFCAVPVFAAWLGPVGQMLGSLERVPWLGWAGGLLGSIGGSHAARWAEALSIPDQFRPFGTGVVPLPGVVYFVALAGAMLYLNMVLLGRRHWAGGQASARRWLHATVRIAALVVALVSLDVLVGLWANVRVDATEGRLHTLSPISRRIVRAIASDRPVFIQAYVSPDVPREFVEVKTNLVNTLRELSAIGGDRIRLNLVEASRYSEEAREAESRFGITPRTVPTEREGRRTTEDVILGVAFTSGLEQVVVPFFDRGLPIEYELIRSIRVVTESERRRVGILETDAHLLGGQDFQSFSQEPEWDIVAELKKQYDVTSVAADTPIPFEEVQTISAAGHPTGGTFTLGYEGETTTPIPQNADADAVAEALASLGSIGEGAVKVEGGPLPGESIRVTFAGKFAGRDVPELTVDSNLEGTERPRVRVATTTQVLDALVVAQAASLTQPQIDNLASFIRKGGPTLILLDPAPVVNFALAPPEPRSPHGGFGPTQPERKGDLGPLLESLNVEWPSDLIVWDDYNPHRSLEVPPESVFIGEASGAEPAFGRDPISSGLQEVFLPFPGLLHNLARPDGPEFTPLLRTSPRGGTLTFDEAIQRAPFGLSRPRPQRPHFPSGTSSTLAAHIQGRSNDEASGRPVHVVVVADLDVISDSIFQLRRRPFEELDAFVFDNVSFILNAVDLLAGDETFVDLRKKRPKHRTLKSLEDEAQAFVKRAQAEQKKAEDTASDRLQEAREALTRAVAEIEQSTEYDERTKDSMVRYRQQVEQRRLDAATAEIEAEKARAIARSKADQEAAVAAIQNRVRVQAVVLTPLPPLLLAGVVFFLRSRRENLGANPERLA